MEGVGEVKRSLDYSNGLLHGHQGIVPGTCVRHDFCSIRGTALIAYLPMLDDIGMVGQIAVRDRFSLPLIRRIAKV
jgi:hypothetical protein